MLVLWTNLAVYCSQEGVVKGLVLQKSKAEILVKLVSSLLCSLQNCLFKHCVRPESFKTTTMLFWEVQCTRSGRKGRGIKMDFSSYNFLNYSTVCL